MELIFFFLAKSTKYPWIPLVKFVITKLISEQLSHNKFSLYNFYFRRFKRIYPALIFMVIVSGALYIYFSLHTNFTNFNTHIKTQTHLHLHPQDFAGLSSGDRFSGRLG